MSHVRGQVRSAAAGILSDGINWRVVKQTRWMPPRDLGNHLLVYVDAESVEQETVHGPALQRRHMTLHVRGRVPVGEGEGTEAGLDSMAAEIETILTYSALTSVLNNKLISLALVGTSVDEIQEENSRVYAEIALEWQAQVITIEGAPETLN